MELKSGDWVRTAAGEVGHIVHIARLTAFVRITPPPEDSEVKAFLVSALTRIDPPGEQTASHLPLEKRQ